MPPPIKPASQEVLQVITVSDITSQILANAQALYPREHGLKVVTGQSSNGLIFYCSIVGEEHPDPKYPKIPPRPKVVLQGDGAVDRRTSMMTLLEQTEKKVAKELLKR